MKRPHSSALLATALLIAPGTSAQTPAAEVRAPRHIGTMTAFWQNRPVLDRWLVDGSLDHCA